MIKKVDLEFSSIEIYDNYFVGRTNEGVSLSLDNHLEGLNVVNQYISPPYGLILDEVNSYSVEFPVIKQLRNDPNIACVGIVYHRLMTKMALSFASRFIGKPSKFSSDYNEIKTWVDEYIKELKKSK